MPRRKFKRKRFRRRRRVRPSRRRVRRRKRLPPLTGFADTKKVRLRYVDQVGIDCPAGGITSARYRSNDMFDPQFSAGGHKPLGFDQNMARYTYFTVIGSRITMTYVPDDQAGAVPGYFGVFNDDAATLQYTSPQELLESKLAKTAVRVAGSAASGNKLFRARASFGARKAFGSGKIIGDLNYAGTESTTPTLMNYFQCWVASVGGNNPDPMNFLIEIEYLAVLHNLKFMPVSL